MASPVDDPQAGNGSKPVTPVTSDSESAPSVHEAEPTLPNAIVTLVTSDDYLPGALVLLHALQALHPTPRDFQIACLVTPETVSAKAIGALRNAGFDVVIGVEPIASGVLGSTGLHLMGRPDLNLALTKLHIFRLESHFATILYMDADTLPLRPVSQLFVETQPHVLSACPDVGWPDCFNSGVMVVRPSSTDFDGLRRFMSNAAAEASNGSFDGADQGLLNAYFSEEGPGPAWNRLPFTYNVTPSAAYQYTPAYKHYADRVSVVHFIGPHKPWQSRAVRPAGLTLARGEDARFKPEYLVDRWYAIYDHYVRPTAVHEPNLAKRFAVPEHVAVWDRPATAGARMDIEDLKAAATGQGMSTASGGRYISLPLDGRVDLIMPVGDPRQPQADPTSTVPVDKSSSSNSPGSSGASPIQRDASPEEHHVAWDGARDPPPTHGRPEMIIPMTSTYTAAWDRPVETHANYFQGVAETPDFPQLPPSVQANDWYKRFTATTPDADKVQPLFPWEQSASRQQPSRVFPKPAEPASAISPRSVDAVGQRVTAPRPPQAAVKSTSAENSFASAMATYTNAWDAVPSIDRYAKGLTEVGIGARSGSAASAASLRTVPSTPRSATPAGRRDRQQSRAPAPGSQGSEDGDDESEGAGQTPTNRAETSGGNRYPSNMSYRDKDTQTDKPRLSDATVQASSVRPAYRSSFPVFRESTPTSGTQSESPGESRGRVWDPKTDIEVRRRDSEQVLSRFVASEQ